MGDFEENACRHFNGMIPRRGHLCRRGLDFRSMAVRANGGSATGIARRLPCTRQKAGADPLFDCPHLDRETDAEVAQRRAELNKRMAEILEAMPIINQISEAMIATKQSFRVADCPRCKAKGALQVHCAVEVNNHVHCRCDACGADFRE